MEEANRRDVAKEEQSWRENQRDEVERFDIGGVGVAEGDRHALETPRVEEASANIQQQLKEERSTLKR